MDIKHVLSRNPLHPAYLAGAPAPAGIAPPKAGWLGTREDRWRSDIAARDSASTTSSRPHRAPHSFRAGRSPRHLREWLSFMEDDGYRRPELWLSDGWAVVNTQHWDSPLYWSRDPDEPVVGSSSRSRPPARDPNEPVCHISYYEADAFAHWTGMRLPTESEWETSPRRTVRATTSLRRRSGRPGVHIRGPRSRPTRSSATPGSGPRARTRRIPGFGRRPAPLVSTTGSSWSASTCSEAGVAPPRLDTFPTYRNFFPAGSPLGVRRTTTREGSLTMAYTIDVHLSPEEVRSQMRADALEGLQGETKSIPPVWFYDERGSRLFEEITQLPEYYPTRAERALLEAHAPSIAELWKADTLVKLRRPARATRPGCC